MNNNAILDEHAGARRIAPMTASEAVAMMAELRSLCAARSFARATEFAGRLRDSLSTYRASGEGARPAMVSMAMDEFIGELRSSLEFGAAPGNPSATDRDRIRYPIEMLNSMYVSSEQALAVGTMAPASFMLGAEAAASSAMRSLHETESYRAHRQQVEFARQRAEVQEAAQQAHRLAQKRDGEMASEMSSERASERAAEAA